MVCDLLSTVFSIRCCKKYINLVVWCHEANIKKNYCAKIPNRIVVILQNIKRRGISSYNTKCIRLHNSNPNTNEHEFPQFTWLKKFSFLFSLTFWHRSFTFNSNKSPTWCNSFSVYYPDVCLQLNMFRAFSRPSSGAQWLQWQPLVLPSYRGDSRAVFVVGPADT